MESVYALGKIKAKQLIFLVLGMVFDTQEASEMLANTSRSMRNLIIKNYKYSRFYLKEKVVPIVVKRPNLWVISKDKVIYESNGDYDYCNKDNFKAIEKEISEGHIINITMNYH